MGLIVECVGNAIERKDTASTDRVDAVRELGFGQFRRFMLPALLAALPVEPLSDDLLERRLQAYLGH